jgi:hypothetical protein
VKILLTCILGFSAMTASAQFEQSFDTHNSQANVFTQQGAYAGTVTVQGVGGSTVNIINSRGGVTTGVITNTQTPGTIGGGVYFIPTK